MDQHMQQLLRAVPEIIPEIQKDIAWSYRVTGHAFPIPFRVPRHVRKLIRSTAKATGESREAVKERFASHVQRELIRKGCGEFEVTFNRSTLHFV